MRFTLPSSGFYSDMTEIQENKSQFLKIKIMHDVFMSNIPLEKKAFDIVALSDSEGVEERIKLSLKEEISRGLVYFDGLLSILVFLNVSLDYVRNRISMQGIYEIIRYDPISTIKTEDKKILGKLGNRIYVMDDLTEEAERSKIIKIWSELEYRVLMNTFAIDMILDIHISAADADKPYLEETFRLVMENIGYEIRIVFPEFSGYADIQTFNKENFLKNLWSTMEYAIARELKPESNQYS